MGDIDPEAGRKPTARPGIIAGFGDPALLVGRFGRWQWYWVLAGHVVFVGLFIAAIIATGAIDEWISAWFGRPPSFEQEALYMANRPETFISAVSAALAFTVPAALVLYFVHGQSWRLGLGRDGRFSWSDFAKTASAVCLVVLIAGVVEFLLYPERFHLRPHALTHLPWIALAALVTFPQAFSEDYLFKGYLARVWGAVLPVRSIIVLASAALFTALHAGNADIKIDLLFMLISFVLGDILMLIVFLRAGSLGAVTGLHWMNNVFAICILTRVPGYNNELALAEYRDATLLAGNSHMTNPESWMWVIVGFLAIYALLTWRRSPFAIPYVAPPKPKVEESA